MLQKNMQSAFQRWFQCHWRALLLYSLLVVSLQACVSVSLESTEKLDVASPGEDLYSEDFSFEQAFLGLQGPAELGVALSGGGPRSANFSIGVLAALHEQRILDHVDYLSSVSGGGYAAYWYYSQLLNMPVLRDFSNASEQNEQTAFQHSKETIFSSHPLRRNDEPTNCDMSVWATDPFCSLRFRNDYRFQRHLEDRSDLLVNATKPWQQNIEYAAKAVTWGAATLSTFVSDLLFDWEINANPIRRYYEHGLERTYGLTPMFLKKDGSIYEPRAGDTYANDSWFLFPGVQAKDISFNELRVATKRSIEDSSLYDGTLPFWIIDTTSGVELQDRKWSEDLYDEVFELTPLGFGAGHYGYIKQTPDFVSISRAVTASGAAGDGQSVNGLARGTRDFFNVDLGLNIENYHHDMSLAKKVYHRVLPIPFYRFSNFKQTNKHVTVHLSDGGHSDNLALFSQIRRGTKTIIVVDAEQDRLGVFKSAKQLQSRLRDQYSLDFSFKNTVPVFYDPRNTKTQIFTGTVTRMNAGRNRAKTDGIPADEVVLNVIYIKLSVDRDEIRQECADKNRYCVVDYYMNKHAAVFPHHSTVDIQYDKMQVAAYRELGHLIGMKLCKKSETWKLLTSISRDMCAPR
ncbi:MAG: patatin-like phospholipase family protein [Pseudomonadales bacterium]|nr:patatin-like phospholipase family protein [Pseudomonadales bacterium]MDG1441378.1 patatin-like phospholipase family protein [Pseudomonadales bacterium]